MKTENEKQILINHLHKVPIVQIACEKSGISRATYYRWRKDDANFAKATDEALLEGSLLVNDMAESQLITAIRDRNLSAITYWLRHHHPTYANKVEILAQIKNSEEALTPEQETVVREALKLASSAGEVASEHDKHDTKSTPRNTQ